MQISQSRKILTKRMITISRIRWLIPITNPRDGILHQRWIKPIHSELLKGFLKSLREEELFDAHDSVALRKPLKSE